jgi:uncharacterized protein with NRDE domain
MCLILVSFKSHSRYPFFFAANRDEHYDRPTDPAGFWDEAPEVLAGRDLKNGGTWMGITRRGRIAAVTHYRDPASVKDDAPSRGWLVMDYLNGQQTPAAYLEEVAARAQQYNGFNLLVGDMTQLFYFSSRGNGNILELSPGLYGLSNHLLDTPWPKVEKGKNALGALLAEEDNPDPLKVFTILSDQSRPDDSRLPDTGVGLEYERLLSPLFITSPVYGTRSSLIMMIDYKGQASFIERSYDAHPEPWMTAKYEFKIQKD